MTKTEIKELKKIKAQFVEDIMSYCVDDFIDIYLRQFGTVSKSLKDDIRKHLMELQYEVEIRDGFPVAFVGYSDEGNYYQLREQAVIPELRGKGITIKLIKNIENRAKEEGKKFLRTHMLKVQGFISKMALRLGWSITGFTKNYLILQKNI